MLFKIKMFVLPYTYYEAVIGLTDLRCETLQHMVACENRRPSSLPAVFAGYNTWLFTAEI